MKTFGYLSLIAVLATMVMVVAGGPAAASEAKDYRIRYVAKSRDFCITPLAIDHARRLGIALYRTECHTLAAWTKKGLTVSYV